MYEEGEAVDAFLVVGGFARQRVAYCAGFQAGANGSRQPRDAVGKRGASPVDLLYVAALENGERQEKDGYPMSYFYLFHNLFLFNFESRFTEGLLVTLLYGRQ
ncbi:MAG: hypothetical protein LUD46_14200 [Parabacteroides sp.]|nr:hypothetical protein [Parabacteroides sp.]